MLYHFEISSAQVYLYSNGYWYYLGACRTYRADQAQNRNRLTLAVWTKTGIKWPIYWPSDMQGEQYTCSFLLFSKNWPLGRLFLVVAVTVLIYLVPFPCSLFRPLIDPQITWSVPGQVCYIREKTEKGAADGICCAEGSVLFRTQMSENSRLENTKLVAPHLWQWTLWWTRSCLARS